MFLIHAARWHDRGKPHQVFQNAVKIENNGSQRPGTWVDRREVAKAPDMWSKRSTSRPWPVNVAVVRLSKQMTKRSSPHSTDYWMDHCAWCQSEIGENDERIAISMRFRDQRDYRKNQGKVIHFELSESGRSIIAAAVTRSSPAKKEGEDILFQVCSDRCGAELSAAIKREWALVDPDADQ